MLLFVWPRAKQEAWETRGTRPLTKQHAPFKPVSSPSPLRSGSLSENSLSLAQGLSICSSRSQTQLALMAGTNRIPRSAEILIARQGLAGRTVLAAFQAH